MKANFWSEVENAYARVSHIAAGERAAFLDENFRDQPDLRREVESLLKYQSAADQITQSTLLAVAAQMFNEDDQEVIGSVVAGKYIVRELLGSGPMSEVFRADHVTLDTPFALKRPAPALKNDPEYRLRLLDEARRAVMLKHDNVARVHDIVESGDDLFVVMEYIEGETLRQRLKALGRPCSTTEFLRIAIQCALALAAAHEKRIVHLDVKPENIILTPAGQVKVCDFGVARKLSKSPTGSTTTLEQQWTFAGTPAYMAPEVILSYQFDERADQFSLGTVFYEMLTGKNPFLADSIVATTARIVKDVPPPISTVNPKVNWRLERIVMRLLAKEPEQRYATTRELVDELEKVRRSQDRVRHIVTSIREGIAEYASVKVAAAVLVLCIVAALSVWTYRDPIQQWLGIAPLPAQKIVVVLPFRAIGDAASKPYSDGLTETLTAMLSQVAVSPGLEVVPASAVRAGGVTTPEQARKNSRANLVVDASLESVGGQVRINIALVDTKGLKQLRATSFTIPQLASVAIQNQIAEAAVKLLEIELKAEQQSLLSVQRTHNGEAYRAYLQGVGYLGSRNQADSVENAIQSFRQAIALDSNFSAAYAGLGEAYWARYSIELKDPQPLLVDRARDACGQALSLDSKLAAAYVCIGVVDNGTGNYRTAVEQFKRALELEPNNDQAFRGLARSHERLNNWEAAEATYIQAIKAQPDYWFGYVWLAQFYLFSRQQHSDAIAFYIKASERAPENPEPYLGLCGAYILSVRYSDAVEACKHSIALKQTGSAYINLGDAFWGLRDYQSAAQSFEYAVQLTPRYYKAVGHLARAYSWLPEKRSSAPELYRKAIDLADEELRINPRNPDINVMVARYHAMLSHKAEAISHLQIALTIRPKDAEYHEIAAVIHNQFGERAVALGYVERAVSDGYSLHRIEAERELDNLREDPRFRALNENKAAKEKTP